jgi:6-phosphogluconolactonase
MAQRDSVLVYVGSNIRDGNGGVYLFRLHLDTGALERIGKAGGVNSASWLALDPKGRYLYAMGDIPQPAGQPSSYAHALAIAPDSGAPSYLNRQPTGGVSACHGSVDQSGRFLWMTNYRGVDDAGSVCVLPILADGRLGEPTDYKEHAGASVHPARQRHSHPHSIPLDPGSRYAFVPDLGIDKVMIYRLDSRAGKLLPNDPPWAQVQPGSGPRHLDFHPNGKYVYLINEIGNAITVFGYDAARGALRELQTAPTLPAGWKGESTTADIHVAPSGRFVYGSNRGHDSLVIYAIDPASGRLSYIGHQLTQGRTPRNFSIDPTGSLLLAANQDSHSIVTFRINAQTGKLTPTGHVAEIPMPLCIKFAISPK